MSVEKEEISAKQLMFSVACYMIGSAMITSYFTATTKQESWIAVIVGYLVSLLILGMYAVLVRLYPRKDLIQINICVFGNVLGRIFSLFYLYFFFSLSFLNTRVMGDFMKGFVMPKTPMIVFLIMFIFVCAWAVRCGVETLTRYSAFLVGISIFVLSLTIILLIKDMRFGNLLPVFSLPLMKYVQAVHTVTMLPFCEMISFFMFFPYVKDTSKVSMSLFQGLTIGFFILLFNTLRNASVLGPLVSILSSPNFEAIRFIDIGHVLTRTEIFYVGVLLSHIFFKVTIVYFATVTAIEKIFGLHSYKTIVPIVGVLIVLFSLWAFGSSADTAFWGTNVAAVYSTFFELVLPAVTLITAGYKKIA